MNSITERWIQTCRRELLDKTLIWNQRLPGPAPLPSRLSFVPAAYRPVNVRDRHERPARRKFAVI
ncbi:hypothetical protein EEJ42_18340 [Streptomyces botrytidirepellens]|uniref:Uncharacterized protein n=1 Tax=Streptomyces botrytidirepellens TaxID=2486417 RepID=A0A3M8W277_9ACTN|nr:hypothetical protein EEJ42_18340 [Streptomyces botrytidirepellens]